VFFFQAEDGIRDRNVTGVQTCALPILMPRRIYTYAGATGWTLWNTVSTVGAFGIAAGVLLFMVNAWRSLRAGAPAPADPWDGRTLEWRTRSPRRRPVFAPTPPALGGATSWRGR